MRSFPEFCNVRLMARPRGFRLNRPALQDLLYAKGMTQADAANVAGIAEQTLSQVVNGGGASMRTVQALVGGLGCDAATLFPEFGNFERKEIHLPAVNAEAVAS